MLESQSKAQKTQSRA